MKESDCTGGRAALQEGLAGDGKTMLAHEKVDDPHVGHKRKTFLQDTHKGRPAIRET